MVAITGILAFVAGLSTAMSFDTADAAAGEGNPLLRTGSAGSPVCGDRLCSEPQSVIDIEEENSIGSIRQEDSSAPTAELISIDKYMASTNKQDAITYKITFRMTAGTEDLKNIVINVKSDMGNSDFEISSLNKLSSSVNVIRVKALDADSITGEIIGYSLTGPTDPIGQFPR